MTHTWRNRFLLDVWAEPRDVESLPAVIRARVRDVEADVESYAGSIAEIAQIIEARLDDDGVTPRRWERP